MFERPYDQIQNKAGSVPRDQNDDDIDISWNKAYEEKLIKL